MYGQVVALEPYELVRSQWNSIYWKNRYKEEQQKVFCCINMQLNKTFGKIGHMQHEIIFCSKLPDVKKIAHNKLKSFLQKRKMQIESQI